MIEENDLRIGNWIFDPHRKEIAQVSEIGWDKEIIHYRRFGIDGELGKWTSYGHNSKYILEPIALTPEILEKCGFAAGISEGIARLSNDIDEEEPNGNTYYWDLKVPNNNHVEGLRIFNLVQFGGGADILWVHQWLRVKVKCLHQFQNLYFTLTGTELNYTP